VAEARTAGESRYLAGILSGDMNGDGRGDFQIEVANAPNFTAADFWL
jgi:hypothetical protein